MTGPDSLRFSGTALGYELSTDEAKQVVAKAGAMLDVSYDRAPISDEILVTVNGSISLAGISAASAARAAILSITVKV